MNRFHLAAKETQCLLDEIKANLAEISIAIGNDGITKKQAVQLGELLKAAEIAREIIVDGVPHIMEIQLPQMEGVSNWKTKKTEELSKQLGDRLKHGGPYVTEDRFNSVEPLSHSEWGGTLIGQKAPTSVRVGNCVATID
jgi:hypothetical protein